MSVPKAIRQVPRPRNTIIEDYGRDTPLRYAVRVRSGTKYVPHGNPKPRNGSVIGHIINGMFVPIDSDDQKKLDPPFLSYGSVALVKSNAEDIIQDLLFSFPPKEAFQIITLAALRIIKPGITARRSSIEYERSFLRVFFPGIPLSENTIGKLLYELGMQEEQRANFYIRRIKATAELHRIAIDGMLKQDTSEINDLSAYSYKSRVRGCKDISILYAYDIENMEPLCAEVFPGNSIDASSYASFIRDNNIEKGIIVADKGFPPSKIKMELEKRPQLHFITPIKRSDSRISTNSMTNYDGILSGVEGQIMYKKVRISGGRYLYSFMDARRASAEKVDYLKRAKDNQSFDKVAFDKKNDLFGVIVFESDQDLTPREVYKCYSDRWLIELVFRRYKNDICGNTTRVQKDFSVIGSEFINFIATTITCRIVKRMESIPLLQDITFGELMDDLSTAWRKVESSDKPVVGDRYWVHTLEKVFEELEVLGLAEPNPQTIAQPTPRKRGRPKTRVDSIIEKKPRGRPKKSGL